MGRAERSYHHGPPPPTTKLLLLLLVHCRRSVPGVFLPLTGARTGPHRVTAFAAEEAGKTRVHVPCALQRGLESLMELSRG